jgi:hypothetical protein
MTNRRTVLTRRALAAGAAAFLALAPVLPANAAAEAVPVKLPTEADALAVAVSIESILYGQQGVETRLPGPVADAERVRVAFGLDGSLVSVSDDQRMELSGVGDFEFKIAGPATDVETLPGSENDPGLRRGSVLWQGFCDGTKSIGAHLDLIAGQEQVRLPLRVALEMTVDGKPVEPGTAVSGELHVRMTVTNNTPLPIQVVDGDVGLRQGAATLDAIRAAVAAGRRPVPGEAGVPKRIQLSNASFRTTELEAPIRVAGSIHLPARRVRLVETTGFLDRTSDSAAGATLPFAAALGGGRPAAHTVELTAQVRDLDLPDIEIVASSGAPAVTTLAPPAGSTWSEGVRSDPSAFDAHAMTGLIMDTMWRVARLRQFDAYLGNPDPTGPARTAYRFLLAPAPGEVAAAPPPISGGPLRNLAGAAIAVVVVLGALVAWSRS